MREKGDVIRGNEKERELTERYLEKKSERVRERERERKTGFLKATVTPVTSHLSNPAPT